MRNGRFTPKLEGGMVGEDPFCLGKVGYLTLKKLRLQAECMGYREGCSDMLGKICLIIFS